MNLVLELTLHPITRKKFLAGFLGLCFWFLNAQHCINLMDQNGEPISYANIQFFTGDTLTGGTYSDNSGSFCIQKKSNTQLFISHLHYRDTTLAVADCPDTLVMKNAVSILREVSVKPTKTGQRRVLGTNLSFLNHSLRSVQGTEIVTYINNEYPKALLIQALKFKIRARKKEADSHFKLVFYQNDNMKPGRKLPTEHVVELGQSFSRKKRIDLAQRQIKIPKEGLFIGLQWIGCLESGTTRYPVVPSKNCNCSIYLKKGDTDQEAETFIRNRFLQKQRHWRPVYEFLHLQNPELRLALKVWANEIE